MEEDKILDETTAIDLLLDDDSNENITLYDEDSNPVEFEQYATIPLNGFIYAIVKPVEVIDGLNEDEAIVLRIDMENESLVTEDDDEIINQVFDEYNRLLSELEEE